MILLTGATGTIGSALLPRLLDSGHQVRALVRDPRRLGVNRVRVQIALGDLADARSFRHALRGIDTVIHLGASIRDQPRGQIEALNGLATVRLLRAAEAAEAERFVFFSALGATEFAQTRFFRSKALAEQAVRASKLKTVVFRPSIVYDPTDPWVSLIRRLSLLPILPISGTGTAVYQPIWATDVAGCVLAAMKRKTKHQLHELAGPETLTYNQIAHLIAGAAGRDRPLVHLPLPLVQAGLRALEFVVGPTTFATWEEAELLEISSTTGRGTEDAQSLGVAPKSMSEVLGL